MTERDDEMQAAPMLQIALDTLTLPAALDLTRKVSNEIDIIEAGTVLCASEGMSAVRVLRSLYPDNIILADIKVADAGGILSKMVFDAGADWMTVICCASLATVELAFKEAKTRGKQIQMELTGFWDMSQARQWRKIGVEQVVYHRSVDAQAAGKTWGESDIVTIRQLAEMGFKVTVVGGIALEDIPFFQGIPVYSFIVGRSVRDAADPPAAARAFRQQISRYWK